MKKAICLFSGGLDSTTVLAMAIAEGYDVYALSFDYGQRHSVELEKASNLCVEMGVAEHKIVKIDPVLFEGSSMTDKEVEVPKHKEYSELTKDVPITFLPGRNTIFLSYALSWAELIGCHDIFAGIIDTGRYPDCTNSYRDAFESLANTATREDFGDITIHAPIINMTKGDIVRVGTNLKVPYENTSSCYDPGPKGEPCGECDACLQRKEGFRLNNIEDPLYKKFNLV